MRYKLHKYKQEISSAIERVQLLPFKPRCATCWDTDIWLPNGKLEICPFADEKHHLIPPHAANIVAREAKRVQSLYSGIEEVEFHVARILCSFSKDNRCPGIELEKFFYHRTGNLTRRWLMHVIESLRSKWLLPIGSSRIKPAAGYWIITGVSEYGQWLEHGLQASRTQFRKFYENARHNYPEFAEQLKLEFASTAITEEAK